MWDHRQISHITLQRAKQLSFIPPFISITHFTHLVSFLENVSVEQVMPRFIESFEKVMECSVDLDPSSMSE